MRKIATKFESRSKASRPITEHVADIIHRKVDASYELNNPRYGASHLCLKCNIDINKLSEDKIEKLRVEVSSRFGQRIPGGDGPCACIICERATLNGPHWIAFVKMWKNSLCRPRSTTSKKSAWCDICLTEVTSRGNSKVKISLDKGKESLKWLRLTRMSSRSSPCAALISSTGTTFAVT